MHAPSVESLTCFCRFTLIDFSWSLLAIAITICEGQEVDTFVKPDQLREFLTSRGVSFEEQEVQYGRTFRCEEGEIFVAYDTGKVVCQGKTTTDLSKTVKGQVTPAKPAQVQTKEQAAADAEDKPVFIVYGHDTGAREGLELVLHKMGLKPIVLENLPADGDTIIRETGTLRGEARQYWIRLCASHAGR